jgi:hypothetical protein
MGGGGGGGGDGGVFDTRTQPLMSHPLPLVKHEETEDEDKYRVASKSVWGSNSVRASPPHCVPGAASLDLTCEAPRTGPCLIDE